MNKQTVRKNNSLLRPKAGALSVLSFEKASFGVFLLAQIPVQQPCKFVGCYNSNVMASEQFRIFF